jgi:hypothetical protein
MIPCTKLFGYNCQIVKLANIMLEKNLPNDISLICKLAIFMANFASQWVLNKDPSVWLDAAKPANTCIPPSFLGTRLAAAHYTHPKNMFQSTKNIFPNGILE